MVRIFALFACGLAAYAQAPAEPATAEPAPPEVDAALRARVNTFFQAHVDGKYRKADEVVAEDSKDFYFAATKPKYLSYEIVRINYSENFTRATAVVACKNDWFLHGEKRVVTLTIPSTWKLEGGQWWWYIVPVREQLTPFGIMHKENPNAPAAAAAGGAIPALPGDPKVLAERILSSVQADKSEVQLSSFEPSSAEVHVKNGMPGPVTLRVDVDGAFPGFSASVDKETLPAGETAVVTFTCKPNDRVAKPTLTARIYVEPVSRVLPIKLTFAIPPEVEKMLPKTLKTPASK